MFAIRKYALLRRACAVRFLRLLIRQYMIIFSTIEILVFFKRYVQNFVVNENVRKKFAAVVQQKIILLRCNHNIFDAQTLDINIKKKQTMIH